MIGRSTLRRGALAGAALAALACAAGMLSAAGDDRGWLGIYTEPVAELPELDDDAGGEAALRGALVGLRIHSIYPRSAAEAGGLLAGDIIVAVGGRPLRCPADSAQAVLRGAIAERRAGALLPLRVVRDARLLRLARNDEAADLAAERRFLRDARAVVDSLGPGPELALRVEVRRAVLDLPVLLGPMPSARWPAPRSNREMEPWAALPPSRLAPLAQALADSFGLRAQTDDLFERLARCHAGADPYRLEAMIFGHRDPFRLESLAGWITAGFGPDPAGCLRHAARLLGPTASPLQPAPAPPLAFPEGRDAFLAAMWAQVDSAFAAAARCRARAFGSFSPQEMAFLEAQRWRLTEVFAERIYIHLDRDRDRFEGNDRLIALAARLDYPALLEAAAHLARLADPLWASAVGLGLRRAFADSLDRDVLVERRTPHGRMIIGGTTGRWHRETDAAFVLDLGGDDFYSGSHGAGGVSAGVPLSLVIDLAGDDAYEATHAGAQGAGCLGVGGLLDLAGDDQYIGAQWCQGAGYFGVGWLDDRAGDDTYRGHAFCQGAGLFGFGLLLDHGGRDRYEADAHAQGVGLPKGIGALLDLGGAADYSAKGRYPTSYGDAGIFDAWSQGCGTGFRTIASGGLGLLLDGGGANRFEAGNFSQGGGYYYGMGILEARGDEGDLYIGSRYNQGFSAHQAVGVFLEHGGDDIYTTRQGVAQGLAWDESVTLFVDAAGDDRYQGGAFFSLGAAAHNSCCLFLDRRGRDEYRYAPGPGRAGGNDYHGGTSLSLFVDEGGAGDIQPAEEALRDGLLFRPEHGFVLDIPGTIEEWLSAR